jgi:hypothetical protein
MSTLSQNPLAKHFRQPILYIKLPSQGQWWPEGSIELPVNGEIPVYAMTARDEITMKTPDALLNGASTVQVIQSCCPNIIDAWKLPLVDLDALLIAIRIATYGKGMDFTATCPHCKTVNENAIDISLMLSKIVPADWSKSVMSGDLEIILKPQSYYDYNHENIMNFDEQRLLQIVQDTDISDDEKTEKYNQIFSKLIDSGISQVSKSISGIRTPDGVVVDNVDFIKEFLDNCDKSVWEDIKSRLNEIKDQTTYNQLDLTCKSCHESFTTPFIFEQTNFFE